MLERTSDRLLILDIDGVLIPSGGPSAEWGEWRQHSTRGDLVISDEMIRSIASLGSEICWLTSWAANANVVVSPFVGWPPLATLTKQTTPGWWKLDAVESLMATTDHRRIGRVDDDIDRYAEEVAERLAPWTRSNRLLLVRPASDLGLTRGEFEMLSLHFDQDSVLGR